MDLGAHEIRVLGCLLEKQRTTPDAYPLTLNALRVACNQSTNRDPVVAYDEATVRDALTRLARRRFTRLTSSAGTRAPKFRHLLDDTLPLPEPSLSVLAVLMLRGAQTPGELKQRVERLHPVGSLAVVGEALEDLIARDLAERLARRPGQKEERFRHRLDAETRGDDAAADGSGSSATTGDTASPPRPRSERESAPQVDDLVGRIRSLEAENAALRARLAELGAAPPGPRGSGPG